MTHAMVTYAVILAACVAGYMQAPGWLVLAGAGCLMLDSWRAWRPGPRSRIEWTSKTTTYFVTGLVLDLTMTAVSFGVGRMARFLSG